MTDRVKEARNEYPRKAREYKERHWERVAQRLAAQAAQEGQPLEGGASVRL